MGPKQAAWEEGVLETDRQIWMLGGHHMRPLTQVVRFQHLNQTVEKASF